MLRLKRTDLTPLRGGDQGVRVWWRTPPGKKRPIMFVAWDSLVLIRPAVAWPERTNPERHEDWGEEALRIVWLPELGRTLITPGVAVPDLEPLEGVARGALPRLTRVRGGSYRRRRGGGQNYFARFLAGPQDSAVYYLRSRHVSAMEAAVGVKPGELEIRGGEAPWSRPSLVALAWKANTLRAVASLYTIAEVEE